MNRPESDDDATGTAPAASAEPAQGVTSAPAATNPEAKAAEKTEEAAAKPGEPARPSGDGPGGTAPAGTAEPADGTAAAAPTAAADPESKGPKETTEAAAKAAAEPAKPTRQPAGPSSDTALEQAARDAQAMLLYAAKAGKNVPPDTVVAVADFEKILNKRAYTTGEQAKFLDAYSKLCTLISPVTIESIRAGRRSGSIVAIVVSVFGFATLMVLIWAQIYFVAISSAYKQIADLTEQQRAASTELFLLKMTNLPSALPHTVNVSSGPPASVLESGTMEEKAEISPVKDLEDAPTEGIKGASQVSTEAQGAARRASLETIIAGQEKLILANYKILSDKISDSSDDSSRPPSPGWLDSEAESAEKRAAIEEWEKRQIEEGEYRREYLLASTISMITMMSSYWLPLLYGLVGTVAYILRSLSHDLKMVQYESSSLINYLMRLPLGMLAGISVGWLFNSETMPSGLAAISPLALAFVAGYSVELVFTAMDRVIAAFTGDPRKGQENASTRPA